MHRAGPLVQADLRGHERETIQAARGAGAWTHRPHETLYYGDNLEILRRYSKDKSVDLVYLDPPFNSNQDYNVLFAEQNGTRSTAQIKTFDDTWRWAGRLPPARIRFGIA